MSQAIADNTHASDAWSTPLADIDVSRSEYYGDDSWRPYFARLRQEDPVHYSREQRHGPYWSVTRHADIKEVDTHHQIYSSEIGGITIGEESTEEFSSTISSRWTNRAIASSAKRSRRRWRRAI